MLNDYSGYTLGQYQIEKMVIDNGIVQTYRAIQTTLRRPVAVQILNPHYRFDPQWNIALIKGAEIAIQCQHPNIIPVIDHGKHQDIDYIVVRLMDGGTLEEKFRSSYVFSSREIASIVSQVSSALDYVHSRGECHGDIATVNIAFDAQGNAYLAEFYLMGYLKVMNFKTSRVGVPAFMAPERWDNQKPTASTDQYSLAAIAYTMLTGRPPGLSPTISSYQLDPIPPVEHFRPEVPTTVNQVLLRALSNEPENRYPTIVEFARQLEQSLKNIPRHIFISYSRRDIAYVHRLRAYLDDNSLVVWLDDAIEHGDQWFNQINDAIRTCAAFVVIMTPEAEDSEWVQKEILLAKRYKKPIFPILLKGEEFPITIDLQFADVRNSQLPGTDFYRRLSRAVYEGR